MKKTITQAVANAAKPKGKAYQIHDPLIQGWILRIQPSGRKTWKLVVKRKPQTIGQFPQMTAAMAKARAMQILSGETDPTPRQVPTLQQFIDDYYLEYAQAHHSRPVATLQFIEHFGMNDRRLDEIRIADIEKYRTRRIKAGIKKSSINRGVGVFKGCLQKAVEWDLIDTNPLSRMKPLKVDRASVTRYLSPDEEERLYGAMVSTDTRIKAIVTVALNTGLRKKELRSLTWADVDLKRRMLTVHGHRAKSKQTRHVPLNRTAIAALKEWRGAVVKMPSLHVFDQRDIRTRWLQLLDATDIQNFRFHDCRHHFASKCVMAGVPLNTVRELLGHSSMAMTLRYAHLAPSAMVDAVELIG